MLQNKTVLPSDRKRHTAHAPPLPPGLPAGLPTGLPPGSPPGSLQVHFWYHFRVYFQSGESPCPVPGPVGSPYPVPGPVGGGGGWVPIWCKVQLGVPVQCQVWLGRGYLSGARSGSRSSRGGACPVPDQGTPLLTDKLKTLPSLTLRCVGGNNTEQPNILGALSIMRIRYENSLRINIVVHGRGLRFCVLTGIACHKLILSHLYLTPRTLIYSS